jgi:hypothetical protein
MHGKENCCGNLPFTVNILKYIKKTVVVTSPSQ